MQLFPHHISIIKQQELALNIDLPVQSHNSLKQQNCLMMEASK